MIGLKEAYEKIKQTHPNEYVHHVNEFPEYYRFILVPNGQKMEDLMWGLYGGTQVDKDTGKMTENTVLGLEAPIHQYVREELEKL